MKKAALILIVMLPALAVMAWAADAPRAETDAPGGVTAARFAVLDVFIDAGTTPLAAYEFEFSAKEGKVDLVGIERGDDANFQDPPYYDPAALAQDRAIVGAFSLAERLPMGKTRVAQLHVRIGAGVQPKYDVKLRAAGSREGQAVPAEVTITEGVSR